MPLTDNPDLPYFLLFGDIESESVQLVPLDILIVLLSKVRLKNGAVNLTIAALSAAVCREAFVDALEMLFQSLLFCDLVQFLWPRLTDGVPAGPRGRDLRERGRPRVAIPGWNWQK
jgi:hypothetical protein